MKASHARRSLLALCVAGAVTTLAVAQTPTPQRTPGLGAPPAGEAEVSRGALLYRVHCASCHGEKGAGDGPVARALAKKPSDLTLLARRAGGEFPRAKVEAAIDGRAVVSAHGTREMPVWGLSFVEAGRDSTRPGEIEAEIQSLVRHLETLQRR